MIRKSIGEIFKASSSLSCFYPGMGVGSLGGDAKELAGHHVGSGIKTGDVGCPCSPERGVCLLGSSHAKIPSGTSLGATCLTLAALVATKVW